MPSKAGSQELASDGPTTRQMLIVWLPLAASLVMMVLEPSIINIGLGRTADPELALAAYGVAYSLALLIEAPILMLLDASVARSVDPQAFAVVRRFTVALGLAVTAIGLIFSLSPLYTLVVEELMNIPPDIAARARLTLQILSFWPLPIAWRRAYQGVLIRAGRTAVITVATGVRLLALAGGMWVGLLLLPQRGAVVAGLAMDLSVVIEAAMITWATHRVLRAGQLGAGDPARQSKPLGMRALWDFYWPLLGTTILRQSMRPVLNAGIAAATLPRASLAAWPVVWGFAILVTGPAWSLQQLATALVTDERAYRPVRRFALGLSVIFTLVLVVAAFTPVYGLVMEGVYNLSPELQRLAQPALQVMALLPLIMGMQALLRGVLIGGGCTKTVRTAMALNMAALVGATVAGVTLLAPTGVILAAVATVAGNLVELLWLYRKGLR